ncbi:uncharacterized protein LOC134818137 [Bolinopsis microptera]|uniref:uncharacterized protein LOC134818137 n=1 Tax=Bolinopsis microptera TaxID=2820187 RepID=UPI003078AA8A
MGIPLRGMGKKKRAAYVEYAIHHRKKYGANNGKNLSIPELVKLANPDWLNEPDEIKEHWKAIAKGQTPSRITQRHETSCQRMDTEAAVMTDMSLGNKWNDKKWAKISKGSQSFKESILSVDSIIDRPLGIIDFSAHVEYMDGFTVPAEFSLVQGTIRNGLDHTSIYNELLRIDPLNKNHLRDGYRNDLKVNCEREHGIDIDTTQNLAIDLEEFCSEITELITKPKDMLLLCRKEDVSRVLGSWYWLKRRYNLPKIQVITLEQFVIIIINYLIDELGRGQCGNKFSEASLTDKFSTTFRDTDPEFRCKYHNTDEACEKRSCTKKNAKKYFYLLMPLLNDFLPEVILEEGKHYYDPAPVGSKKRAGRPLAPANTPAPSSRSPEPEPRYQDFREEPEVNKPRRPQETYSSSQNKCSNNNERSSPTCDSGNSSASSNTDGLVNDGIPPERPRRPKTSLKKVDDKTLTKSSLSYDPVYQQNGASAVEVSLGRQGLSGRGRARYKSSSPSPPPGHPAHPSCAALEPGVNPPTLSAKQGSYGRGRLMFAAAQVPTMVSRTETLSVSDQKRYSHD